MHVNAFQKINRFYSRMRKILYFLEMILCSCLNELNCVCKLEQHSFYKYFRKGINERFRSAIEKYKKIRVQSPLWNACIYSVPS